MIANKISISDYVSALELSMPTARCLEVANIILITDLVQRSELEILRIPNFDQKSLNDLREILANMGLSFGMSGSDIKLALNKERAQRIESLIAKHKECNIRCQTLEKRVKELIDAYCADIL